MAGVGSASTTPVKFFWVRGKESSAFFHGRDGGRKSRIGKGEITRGDGRGSGIDEIVQPTDFALMEGPAAMRASKYLVAVRRENAKSGISKTPLACVDTLRSGFRTVQVSEKKIIDSDLFTKIIRAINGESNLTSGLAFDTSQILIFSV